MLELLCLRHAPTQWNALKRLQGRANIPLTPAARLSLEQLQMPEEFTQIPWYCSPLNRAIETASLLGLAAIPEPALIEMDWGHWEGMRIDDLRQANPLQMATREAMGLDLQPPGGESPRQVQQRVSVWAESLRLKGVLQVGAVCHKGVIRALLAGACEWDMRGKAPVKLDYRCLQHFRWDGLRWHLKQTNLPLK